LAELLQKKQNDADVLPRSILLYTRAYSVGWRATNQQLFVVQESEGLSFIIKEARSPSSIHLALS